MTGKVISDQAAAVYYAVRTKEGPWVGIWNDRANAELVKSKGPASDTIVELVERTNG